MELRSRKMKIIHINVMTVYMNRSQQRGASPKLNHIPNLCQTYVNPQEWVLVNDAQNHRALQNVCYSTTGVCRDQRSASGGKMRTNLSVMVKQGAWLPGCDSWANIRAGFTVDPWWCWQLVCGPSHWVLLSTAPLVLFAHQLQFWKRRRVRAPEPHIQTQKPFAVLLKQSLLIDESRPSNSLLLIACENLELGLITESAIALNHAKHCVIFWGALVNNRR